MSAAGSELGALSHALAAHLRRRGALGLRALPAVAPPAPAPRTAAPSPAPAEAPRATPPEAPRAAQAAQAAPPAPTAPTAPESLRATGEAQPTRRRFGPGGDRESAPRPAAKAAPAPIAVPTGPDSPTALAPACATLGELAERVAACTACPLAQTRTRTVFADGTGSSGILFVGEGPGAEEDRQGVPFVGRAGQLLTDIITKGMGLSRDQVAIVNVVKCRPPENRDPSPEEKAACAPWLARQLELFDPKVIVPLGRHAASTILGVDAPLGRVRARVHDVDGRRVVPTYHPAYLLRAPQEKRKTWEDIQLAMAEAGIPVPGKPGR